MIEKCAMAVEEEISITPEFARRAVRAVLLALREPTEEMLEASHLPGLDAVEPEQWQAIIDSLTQSSQDGDRG